MATVQMHEAPLPCGLYIERLSCIMSKRESQSNNKPQYLSTKNTQASIPDTINLSHTNTNTTPTHTYRHTHIHTLHTYTHYTYTCIHADTHTHTDTQTDRQTDRQAVRDTDRHDN